MLFINLTLVVVGTYFAYMFYDVIRSIVNDCCKESC